MATLYLDEFYSTGSVGTIPMAVPPMPPLVQQNLAIGASSVQSAAFGANTHLVMVAVDAICSIAVGSNPTAVATYGRLAANERLFLAVNPGDKLAVITNT